MVYTTKIPPKPTWPTAIRSTSFPRITNTEPKQQFEEYETQEEVNEENYIEERPIYRRIGFSRDPYGQSSRIVNLNNIMKATHLLCIYIMSDPPLTILIDTGASDSIISTRHYNQLKNQIYYEPFKLIACNNTLEAHHHVDLELLNQYRIRHKFKCRMIDWHC
ncbi:hypothetical protein GWI33_013557 [Rhynchophorus ferrugineus]|uniref:Peptidase A2 domain-containing protein n=1 Tax=Rhynchophorus ferrugineus TaxID=354439 RepID=A0A834I7W1_RHYFE|nr:hypothetical protein GWI33_013557 [Rhynchophorus ferrugineus]